MSLGAAKAYRTLKGLFAVYKLPNVSIEQLVAQVNTQLLKELNELEQGPKKQIVAFKKMADLTEKDKIPHSVDRLLSNHENKHLLSGGNLVVPTHQVDWFDHPLVQGPRYTKDDLTWHFGHTLDYESSGVQLLGLQKKGRKLLDVISKEKPSRTYEVKGRFGISTTTYTLEGKVMERTTWNHIKAEQIRKTASLIQGSHRNSLFSAADVDLSSHGAYVAACKGTLKPRKFLGPLFLNIELTEFSPPEFAIKVTCLDESCQALRSLVHHIGRRLYSSAVTTKIRRTSDGIFSCEHPNTLLAHRLGGVERVVDVMQDSFQRILKDDSNRQLSLQRNKLYYYDHNVAYGDA